MSIRTSVILAIALAVAVTGGLGTANGMVLCIDADGHLAVEAPHLSHALHHAAGADHEPHDHGGDADHAALHEAIASCSDWFVSVQNVERTSPSDPAAVDRFVPIPDLYLPAHRAGDAPTGNPGGLGVATFRGGTARPELATLRSVILLV